MSTSITRNDALSVVSLLCLLAAGTINLSAQNAPKTLTSQDYARAESMLTGNASQLVDRGTVQPNWLPDGKFWYRVLLPEGSEYILVNPADASRKIDPELSKLPSAEVRPGRRIRSFVPSPDGKKSAFIRDWNLWLRDSVSKKETQITTDGVKDFGYATDNAGWRHSDNPVLLWSPDSKKIATYRQDQRHVSDMYLVKTKVGAPTLEAWKYPLPEDKEVIMIQRVIIDVEKLKVTSLNIPPDPRRGTICDDISCSGSFDDNDWSADGSTLAFVSTSRDHKIARLRIANATTGAVSEVMQETVATQFESGRGVINWRYLPESGEFLWYSERDDWGHLYLYDTKGKLKNQITKGNFVVTRLLRVDNKNRLLYFEAKGREAGRDPYFTHFYSTDFAGKNLKLLTPEDGHHEIELSPDGKYFVDKYSKPNVPATVALRDMKGKIVMPLEKTDISRLTKKGWKAPVPITVKSNDARWDLYGLMYLPTGIDTTRKYPVINYIYPGPQGGSVGSRSFLADRSESQALAELGFVVIKIDGSCNPDRSKSFHDACYGDIGGNTLEDQISGMRQLAAKHKFIDLERVGIWGHSGGGFATGAAMLRYPDFFKVGISESGNHDNRNYEDDWGERYIGLMDQGGANYEKQANQNMAKNLKGKLLFAHGGLDDNVPPYNTYLVMESLISANKDFDFLLLPNARHGYGKDSFYMMRRRWDYFVRHLLQAEPPAQYELKQRQDPRVKR